MPTGYLESAFPLQTPQFAISSAASADMRPWCTGKSVPFSTTQEEPAEHHLFPSTGVMGVSNHWSQTQSTGLVSGWPLSWPGSGCPLMQCRCQGRRADQPRAVADHPLQQQSVEIGCSWLSNPAPNQKWHGTTPYSSQDSTVLMETTNSLSSEFEAPHVHLKCSRKFLDLALPSFYFPKYLSSIIQPFLPSLV